jgi:hypothetical protein
MSAEPLRVPAVRDVAIAGDTALVRGYPAWFLHRVLRGYPGGLEALLARSGVPQERRRDILQAQLALGQAGALWRLESAASTSGSPEGDESDAALPSEGAMRSLLSAADAASVLGVSDRQVRALALSAHLRGQRDPGGRWWFAPADVHAERERREALRAA